MVQAERLCNRLVCTLFVVSFCFDFTESCFGAMMKSSIEAAALFGEQLILLPLFPLLFKVFSLLD